MMLASRNIMLPALYTSYADKCNFYKRSNAALKGDYSVIEHDVLERIDAVSEVKALSEIVQGTSVKKDSEEFQK